jgi:hypothetical protein
MLVTTAREGRPLKLLLVTVVEGQMVAQINARLTRKRHSQEVCQEKSTAKDRCSVAVKLSLAEGASALSVVLNHIWHQILTFECLDHPRMPFHTRQGAGQAKARQLSTGLAAREYPPAWELVFPQMMRFSRRAPG